MILTQKIKLPNGLAETRGVEFDNLAPINIEIWPTKVDATPAVLINSVLALRSLEFALSFLRTLTKDVAFDENRLKWLDLLIERIEYVVLLSNSE